MKKTDVAIIGGGQSGLAMSRSLSALGIDHVVLERGQAGERWHTQRWDSLNLLTTTGMSALPGLSHDGLDPDGFMSAKAFAKYLSRYARVISAPLVTGAEVESVERLAGRFHVRTTAGCWLASAVVIATGACDAPYRPHISTALDARFHQIDAAHYRRPGDLPDGGVLVVGASASGVQLAKEIQLSGRQVTLSVGAHFGAPRRYRGKDLYVWLEETGILDEEITDRNHREAMLRLPSLQLIGTPDNRDIGLDTLWWQGVRLVGRMRAATAGSVEFEGDLEASTGLSHARKLKMLNRLDELIARSGLAAEMPDPAAREPFVVASERHVLDLGSSGVRSIVWATGYVRRYGWLHLPVFDGRGELDHDRGLLPEPGVFAIGLNFLRRRRSSFIDGCARDAAEIAPLIGAFLEGRGRRAA